LVHFFKQFNERLFLFYFRKRALLLQVLQVEQLAGCRKLQKTQRLWDSAGAGGGLKADKVGMLL
jgi:hypothetical protein